MSNWIVNSGINLSLSELISYFSVELICFLGIILNLILYPFVMQNVKLKRYSNFIACITFCLNSIVLVCFLFQNEWFSIKNDLVVISPVSTVLKLFINIFALFFVLSTYKYINKAKYKIPLVNSIFILIILLCGLLLSSDNFTFIYVLLEAIIILIYKYASCIRLNKNSFYSPVYIAISFCATFLFVTFYFLDYLVEDLLQKSIMQSCIILALLLKIGLFPIFNYSMDKKCRNNISYTILIFCLLPFVGAVAFNKIISFCMFNEVCMMSASVFVVLCAFCSCVTAYKIKSLSGYLINLGQIFACFYILNSILIKDINPQFMFGAVAVLFILFAMLRIYKNSKKYTLIFSMMLLVSATLILTLGYKILYNIYTFDKTGYFAFIAFIFFSILLTIKTLVLVEGFYKNKI